MFFHLMPLVRNPFSRRELSYSQNMKTTNGDSTLDQINFCSLSSCEDDRPVQFEIIVPLDLRTYQGDEADELPNRRGFCGSKATVSRSGVSGTYVQTDVPV